MRPVDELHGGEPPPDKGVAVAFEVLEDGSFVQKARGGVASQDVRTGNWLLLDTDHPGWRVRIEYLAGDPRHDRSRAVSRPAPYAVITSEQERARTCACSTCGASVTDRFWDTHQRWHGRREER